jgi:hypothetical protein
MALLTMLFSSIVMLHVLQALLYIQGNCNFSCSLSYCQFVIRALNFKGMNYLKRNSFSEGPFVWEPPQRWNSYLKRIFYVRHIVCFRIFRILTNKCTKNSTINYKSCNMVHDYHTYMLRHSTAIIRDSMNAIITNPTIHCRY